MNCLQFKRKIKSKRNHSDSFQTSTSEAIIEKKDDQKKHHEGICFIENQGQLSISSDDGNYIFSSGILLNNHFEVNGLKILLGDKALLLTCAHNFLLGEKRIAEEAVFCFKKIIDKSMTKMDAMANIIGFHAFFDLMEKKTDPFDDIVISICNDNLKGLPSSNISFLDVSKAKKEDIICLIGYSVERNGKLFNMKGTIHDIKYRNNDDEAIILYKDINETKGLDGSPVYLKQHNGSWKIIGFHVGYSSEYNANIAIGLTNAKLSWLVIKVHQTLLPFTFMHTIENFFRIEKINKLKLDEIEIDKDISNTRKSSLFSIFSGLKKDQKKKKKSKD